MPNTQSTESGPRANSSDQELEHPASANRSDDRKPARTKRNRVLIAALLFVLLIGGAAVAFVANSGHTSSGLDLPIAVGPQGAALQGLAKPCLPLPKNDPTGCSVDNEGAKHFCMSVPDGSGDRGNLALVAKGTAGGGPSINFAALSIQCTWGNSDHGYQISFAFIGQHDPSNSWATCSPITAGRCTDSTRGALSVVTTPLLAGSNEYLYQFDNSEVDIIASYMDSDTAITHQPTSPDGSLQLLNDALATLGLSNPQSAHATPTGTHPVPAPTAMPSTQSPAAAAAAAACRTWAQARQASEAGALPGEKDAANQAQTAAAVDATYASLAQTMQELYSLPLTGLTQAEIATATADLSKLDAACSALGVTDVSRGGAPSSTGTQATTITITGGVNGSYTGVTIYAHDHITDCAAHAYGQSMVSYLTAHPCSGAYRVLVTINLSGRLAVLAATTVAFPPGPGDRDGYQASSGSETIERAANNSGVTDLLFEGHRIPVASAIPTDEAFTVTGQDNYAWVMDAWWATGNTQDQDSTLVAMENGIFLSNLFASQ